LRPWARSRDDGWAGSNRGPRGSSPTRTDGGARRFREAGPPAGRSPVPRGRASGKTEPSDSRPSPRTGKAEQLQERCSSRGTGVKVTGSDDQDGQESCSSRRRRKKDSRASGPRGRFHAGNGLERPNSIKARVVRAPSTASAQGSPIKRRPAGDSAGMADPFQTPHVEFRGHPGPDNRYHETSVCRSRTPTRGAGKHFGERATSWQWVTAHRRSGRRALGRAPNKDDPRLRVAARAARSSDDRAWEDVGEAPRTVDPNGARLGVATKRPIGLPSPERRSRTPLGRGPESSTSRVPRALISGRGRALVPHCRGCQRAERWKPSRKQEARRLRGLPPAST